MSINWSSFESLPGDSRINFENLCRGIVRAHWAQYGQFTALKNQPGVEFHLNLSNDCPTLGDASRWYGWQCKKFDITRDGSLTAASKAKITASLDKTLKHLAHLTDWVLWTPYTLSKSDQKWFQDLGLKYPYSLHLWADEEIENNLAGPALMLRGTYFGELVITPDDLKARHDESITPIKDRWINPVHQKTDIERTIRRMLGEPDYWQDMVALGQGLSSASSVIGVWKSTDSTLASLQTLFVEACSEFSEMLLQFHKILSEGDIDVIQQWLSNRKSLIDLDVISLPRLLRKQNMAIALEVTNALDDMRIAQSLFDEVEEYLDVGMVAVLADAGGGKTHMAAELSSAQESRPAGILLHGRNFHRGQNQHDLSRQYLVNGTPLDSMDKMLASLDAAAKRARCILPLVIDGLNEAENPKEWKDVLSYIQATIKNYPNVLVICTLRTGEHKRPYWSHHETETRETFAVQSLPDDIWEFECEGFGEDVYDAIDKYFEYYKIVCEGSIEIPTGFLSHPLNLRIFCDVINPKREDVVEVDYFPASLAHLFDEHLQNTCNRIATMKNFSYSSQELKDAIYQFGISLWESKDREIDDLTYRDLINDSPRNWNASIINLFAQEGIIFRNPAQAGKYVITPVYDALGGHIIADALLKKYVQDRSFKWFSTPFVQSAFGGENSHSLAYDIFKSLVALVPSRMHGEQLWKNVPESYKQKALLHASELNAEHLDNETVNKLASLINEKTDKVSKVFSRLWLTKGAPKHPLNADFLDSVLRKMSISKRDLNWTEWMRDEQGRDKNRFIPELSLLETSWKENTKYRSESDRLRAKAIKWLLTSTNYQLRDATTKALYWYGIGDPEFLFNETIKSLEINDPYVPERMLTASYGVGMSLSIKISNNPSFTKSMLFRFAGNVFEAIFKEGAEYYTTHHHMRDFALRIIELAQYHEPNFFSDSDLKRASPPFSADRANDWGEKYLEGSNDEGDRIGNVIKSILGRKLHHKINGLLPQKWKDKNRQKRINVRKQSPFLMDFENYTIGRLVPGRGNYNYDHKEYQKVRAQLQWRVEQLGWTHEKFEEVEKSIQNWQGYERRSNEKLKTDRYGKKYSWIAYYEMHGLLEDRGILDENDNWRRSDAQNIDPSFSEPIAPKQLIDIDFLASDKADTTDWIRDGALPNIEPYLQLQKIGEEEGAWVALDGYVNQESKNLKRETFMFVRSFLVPKREKDEILEFLSKHDISGDWLPEKPSFSQTFFSEIPWSSALPRLDTCDFSFIINEKAVTRKRPKVDVVMNEEGLSIVTLEEYEEYEELDREYKTFKAIMPVCSLMQNVTDSEAGNAPSLTKNLAIDLELIAQPQSFDLFTKSGDKASHYVSYWEKGDKDRHSMYYLKKELLDSFMENNEMSLIWMIWGERNHSYSWTHRPHDNVPEPAYKDFSMVKEYV